MRRLAIVAALLTLALTPAWAGEPQPTVPNSPLLKRVPGPVQNLETDQAVVMIVPEWRELYPFSERFQAAGTSGLADPHVVDLAAMRFATDALVSVGVNGERQFAGPDLRSFPAQLVRSPFLDAAPELFIVQAASVAKLASLRRWADVNGIAIAGYVPDSAYLMRLDETQFGRVKNLADVFWTGFYQPAFRVEPKLDYIIESNPFHQIKLRANFEVERYATEREVLAALQNVRATVLDITRTDREWTVRLQGEATSARSVVTVPGCLWIERFVDYQLHNNVARTSTNVTTGRGAQAGPIMDVEDVWARGIRGEGQIASAADTGLSTGTLSTLHADYGQQGSTTNPMRVIKGYALGRTTWDDDQTIGGGHGTHTSGSIVGNGFRSGADPSTNTFPTTSFAGNAPKAQFVFQSVMDSQGSLGGLPADLTQLFQSPYNDGARVHSNSWGAAVAGAYDQSSQDVDKFVWNNKDMVITVSAGNEGVDGKYYNASSTCVTNGKPLDGVVDTDSIGSPATAKNCITVGATENYRPDFVYEYPQNTCTSSDGLANKTWGWFNGCSYSLAPIKNDLMADNANGMGAFSSRGPTDDGRVKPDVVAPGIAIVSTRTDKNQAYEQWGVCVVPTAQRPYYMTMGGTSMSNPLTAGTAVLVRQYYSAGWHANNSSVTNGTPVAAQGFNPSAALVKATLINGAWDMAPGQYGTGATREIPAAWDTGRDLPNNVEGFGRVDLEHSLFPGSGWGDVAGRVLEVHDVTPGLATGQNQSYTFQVGGAGNPLIVTLVWTDPYATTGAGKKLVNDLDLTVTSPTGTVYYPNNLNKTSGADHVNNVEQVKVTSPATGTWTIAVNGYAVPGNGVAGTTTQPFALVISGVGGSCTPPAAPAGVTAAANGGNRIDVNWSAVTGATEYRVLRGTATGGPYTQVGVAAAPATTYADTTVTAGTTYYYVVRAFLNCESANSNEASATATATPDFTIAASPASVSAVQGAAANTTISTTVSGGFNAAIALSASGLPTGATAAFNPTSIAAPGSGSSTLTLTAGAATPTGTYTVTVTGSGNGTTHTATVSFAVTAAPVPDFTIAASPTAVSAAQGASATSTISTTVSGGFNAAVALSASGLPTGATAAFNPVSIAAPGSGSSVLTLTAGAATPTGTYAVTVTGSGGGKTKTATVSFTVTLGGVTTLLTDGFESTGWSTAQVSGTAGAWTYPASGSRPSATPHGGSKLAAFNSYTAASGSQTRLYRTAGFAVASNFATVTLTFWMYHDSGYSTYNDRVQPQVSTNGTTWTSVGTAVSRYSATTGWTQHTVDLSSYRGAAALQVAFLGISAYGNDCYLDDVLVTAQGTVTTSSISGTVTLAAGGGLANVVVSAGSASGTSNTSGAYTIAGLTNGTYTVTPTLAGYTFTPASQSVTVNGANVTAINFTAAPGATTLFSDGFEGTGWATAQVSGTAGKWTYPTAGTHPTTAPHGGTKLGLFNSWTAASGNKTRVYRSAGFAVPATFTTVTLKFWMYHDTGYSSANDNVQAQASTNGTTWTNVGTAVSRYDGSTGWKQVTIDVSSYKGQTLYLGFVGTSAYGNDCHLDDVTVIAQ